MKRQEILSLSPYIARIASRKGSLNGYSRGAPLRSPWCQLFLAVTSLSTTPVNPCHICHICHICHTPANFALYCHTHDTHDSEPPRLKLCPASSTKNSATPTTPTTVSHLDSNFDAHHRCNQKQKNQLPKSTLHPLQ